MHPLRIAIDPAAPDPAAVAAAVAALRRGSLAIFPTETVYGLAADPSRPEAMAGLYGAKGRPDGKPIALFARDVAQVRACGVCWPPAAAGLAARFWPGPLTLVLAKGGEQIGFRIPDHPVPQALLRAFGGALAVTSANRSGEEPVRDGAEAAAVFSGRDVVILDAGPAGSGAPSTVVRVDAEGWRILRAGALAEEALRAAAADPQPR